MHLILISLKRAFDFARESLTNCIVWQDGAREEGFLPHPSAPGGVILGVGFLQVLKSIDNCLFLPLVTSLSFSQENCLVISAFASPGTGLGN